MPRSISGMHSRRAPVLIPARLVAPSPMFHQASITRAHSAPSICGSVRSLSCTAARLSPLWLRSSTLPTRSTFVAQPLWTSPADRTLPGKRTHPNELLPACQRRGWILRFRWPESLPIRRTNSVLGELLFTGSPPKDISVDLQSRPFPARAVAHNVVILVQIEK